MIPKQYKRKILHNQLVLKDRYFVTVLYIKMFSKTQIFYSVTLFYVIFNSFVPSIAVQVIFYEHSNHEGTFSDILENCK